MENLAEIAWSNFIRAEPQVYVIHLDIGPVLVIVLEVSFERRREVYCCLFVFVEFGLDGVKLFLVANLGREESILDDNASGCLHDINDSFV